MAKYKVGDTILLRAKITRIDDEKERDATVTYRVLIEDVPSTVPRSVFDRSENVMEDK